MNFPEESIDILCNIYNLSRDEINSLVHRYLDILKNNYLRMVNIALKEKEIMLTKTSLNKTNK